MMNVNYVYFIDSADGFVKIGVSGAPSQRLVGLQISTPHVCTIRGCFEGSFELEHKLHKHLRGVHVRGEWFRAGADVDAAFDSLSRKMPMLPCEPKPCSEEALAWMLRGWKKDVLKAQTGDIYTTLEVLMDVVRFHIKEGASIQDMAPIYEAIHRTKALLYRYQEEARDLQRERDDD